MDVDINCFTRNYFVLNAVVIRSIIREVIRFINNYIRINLIVRYLLLFLFFIFIN